MGDDIEDRLAAATARRHEHRATEARLADLDTRLRDLTAEVSELRRVHDLEARDVARIEGFSLTSVIASLRGARDDAIARERAEAEAAEYRVAEAEARWSAIRREHEATAARLAELTDAPNAYQAALVAKERYLAGSGDARGSQLLTLAEERGAVSDELREIVEADQAAQAALAALDQLSVTLESATLWSTYDTALGGGLVGSAIKHSRLDQAADEAAYADQCLSVLRSELADVVVPDTSPALSIDGLTRFLDVWLDNIFSDLSVHKRIGRARRNVADCQGHVSALIVGLEQRADAARARRLAIDDEREALLTR